MGLGVRVAGNTVYSQMHARARRISGDSHELALRNVPITITVITIRSVAPPSGRKHFRSTFGTVCLLNDRRWTRVFSVILI
jgi:hypothetical protein